MNVRRISVSFGATRNLQNYQSARFDAGVEADLEPGEDVEEAFAQLHRRCVDEVWRQIAAQPWERGDDW